MEIQIFSNLATVARAEFASAVANSEATQQKACQACSNRQAASLCGQSNATELAQPEFREE